MGHSGVGMGGGRHEAVGQVRVHGERRGERRLQRPQRLVARRRAMCDQHEGVLSRGSPNVAQRRLASTRRAGCGRSAASTAPPSFADPTSAPASRRRWPWAGDYARTWSDRSWASPSWRSSSMMASSPRMDGLLRPDRRLTSPASGRWAPLPAGIARSWESRSLPGPPPWPTTPSGRRDGGWPCRRPGRPRRRRTAGPGQSSPGASRSIRAGRHVARRGGWRSPRGEGSRAQPLRYALACFFATPMQRNDHKAGGAPAAREKRPSTIVTTRRAAYHTPTPTRTDPMDATRGPPKRSSGGYTCQWVR